MYEKQKYKVYKMEFFENNYSKIWEQTGMFAFEIDLAGSLFLKLIYYIAYLGGIFWNKYLKSF